jgi:hypothetical protein
MATIIDRGQAQSLIQQFRKDNSSAGGPALLTPEGKFLNGFFIDADGIKKLLNDTPNLAGIHVYFAKHPSYDGKPDRVYTTMFVASVNNTTPGAATPYTSSGDILDMVPPCPPYCNDL